MKHLLFNNQQSALFTTAVHMSITSSKNIIHCRNNASMYIHTYFLSKLKPATSQTEKEQNPDN